uniref:Uncharacterized protein n=1 Tax=Bartonella rochalimae ATCC BAA-1498 TaxID=685782 RepID=E6YKD9_9HYPH|nr:hypothetical protein BARRO_10260 [Bartonella rochalimae ATCC BAA-1498]
MKKIAVCTKQKVDDRKKLFAHITLYIAFAFLNRWTFFVFHT